MRVISSVLLKLIGWKLDDQLADIPRCVLIAYPHTSNWDFVLGMLAKWAMGLPLNWVGKHSMFWGPFRPLFVSMGGVPLNRQKSSGFIEEYIQLFARRETFVLGIMPEGTRAKTGRLKSGFYHIAVGADVPIALAYLDYKNKIVGIGKVFKPCGDIEVDFDIIKTFYLDKTGYRPENQGELRILKGDKNRKS